MPRRENSNAESQATIRIEYYRSFIACAEDAQDDRAQSRFAKAAPGCRASGQRLDARRGGEGAAPVADS